MKSVYSSQYSGFSLHLYRSVMGLPAFYELDSTVFPQHIKMNPSCKGNDVTRFNSGKECEELGQVARGSLWQFATF